jgi:hypothetical protein
MLHVYSLGGSTSARQGRAESPQAVAGHDLVVAKAMNLLLLSTPIWTGTDPHPCRPRGRSQGSPLPQGTDVLEWITEK